MRQICKYSGIILIRENVIGNLKKYIPGHKRASLSISHHPLFSSQYSLEETVKIASSVPYETMTPQQRHLLAIALMHKTSLLKIDFPINDQVLPANITSRIFPLLLESCARIVGRTLEWESILDYVPKFVVNKDNWDKVNLESFVKTILYRETGLLLYTNPREYCLDRKSAHEKLDDEIQFEKHLKKVLSDQRREHYRKYIYKIAQGKWVLQELKDEYRKAHSKKLPADIEADFNKLLVSKPENSWLTSKRIKYLRSLILEYLPIPLDEFSSQARANTSMTIKFLDGFLSYNADVVELFGGIKTTTQVAVKGVPVEWEINKIPSASFPPSQIELQPVNKNLEKTAESNSTLARILAKRKERKEGTQEEQPTDKNILGENINDLF